MSDEDKKFLAMAIEEARKGLQKGEQPFGSVIVRNGEVVGRAYNTVNSSGDPTNHAETAAVRDASANLKGSDWKECTLYTSCDPCPMCAGATMFSGIERLVIAARSAKLAELRGQPPRTYSAENLAGQMHMKLEVIRGLLQSESEEVLAHFDWSTL